MQFFLAYHINFKISTWNSLIFRRIFGGGITNIVSILDFMIWFPNLMLTILNIPRIQNRIFVISNILFIWESLWLVLFPLNGLLMLIIFYFDCEPLMIIFSAIPLFDIIKFIKNRNNFQYNYNMYLRVATPGLLIVVL